MGYDYSEVINRTEKYSPYLNDCLSQFPDIKKRFENGEAAQSLIDDYSRRYLGDIADFETEMSRLRIYKRAVHLICALADLAREWSWVEVTQTLSDLADVAIKRLLRAAAIKAGISGDDDNPVPGLFVIAMGKHGACELNYSSDIDFTVFYDPDHIALPDMERAERTLIRLVRDLIKGLEQRTADGYIFRTDLRLRPDPRSNAIVISTLTAERYYETIGQNWERAALIKARICGGDRAVGDVFKRDVLSPFIWRRSLDYAAIEDIQAIKRQIDARSGGDVAHAEGHHVKLGRGGIREIEFYAQVQQLILGGRYPDLRCIRTVDALQALTDGGFVAQDVTDELSRCYGLLRDLEHGVQMVRDEQDHILPIDHEARERLARLRGYNDLADFDGDAVRCFTTVSRIYRELYPEADSLASDQGSLVFTGVDPDPATLETLKEMGFERAIDVWRLMAEWLGGRIAATRTVRARELLTRLAPHLLKSCQDTGQSDRAFFAFARFFTGLRTGVNSLSMFVQSPNHLQKIIASMTLSERVADQLANDPSIMDAMVEPNYLKITPTSLMQAMQSLDLGAEDFEGAMNAVRVFVKELRFRIILAALEGQLDHFEIMELCSCLAEQTLTILLAVAARETERIFGPIKGQYGIIGLGKLGGSEMRLTSDLDIMLLYQAHPEGESRADIYTKLTQRLVSALSAITGEGGLYEVDLDLRPSGRSGPVAVSLEAFAAYYREKAWTWEFMALTRAKLITGSSTDFQHVIEDHLQQAISCERPVLNMTSDIAEMLERTRLAKPAQSEWDIKNSVGGLRDIEYIAQTLWLKARTERAMSWPRSTQDMLIAAKDVLGVQAVQTLNNILSEYHKLQQWQSLLGLSTLQDEDTAIFLKSDLAQKLSLTLDENWKNSAQLTVRDLLSEILAF